jgi:hypothetical protein
MLETIMHTNYFEHNLQLYYQTEGLAMGTNCAVSVANRYMAILIDSKLKDLPGKRLYSRYIDDICFIYKGSIQEFKALFSYANSLQEKITFINAISKHTLDVLDITFYSKNNSINFKTF